jgi:MFS transporter, FSR family, fosmidomycin resistance protein
VLGVLAGGFIADRFGRHTMVAILGMAGGSLFSLLIGLGPSVAVFLGAAMTLAGFCLGLMGPSRDLLVRSAAPPGATGKVYGFVYSGLDLGSALVPLFFGWLIDHGQPRAMFVSAAILLLVTVMPILQVHRHALARA